MNVSLIAAVSADGKIAERLNQSSLDWTSAEDTKSFVEKTKEIGTVIMGRKTFATIGKALKDRRLIVMTSNPDSQPAIEGVEYTSNDPKTLVQRLEQEGCTQIVVAGGSAIYGQFLAAGLVTDFFLTLEPVLFGQGVPLGENFPRVNLELVEIRQLNSRSILLHYRAQQSMMKPVAERTPDYQYHDLLKKIMDEGIDVKPIQGESSRMILGAQMHFSLENGFPMMTERDLSGRFMVGALGEHFAFLHGARTQEELKAFGCAWWKRWVTKERCDIFNLPEGDLGPGSYGPAWTAFPTAEGAPFNQIEHVVKQIKERPNLRTHIISPWIPQYTLQHSELPPRKVVVAPCHGYLHVLVFPETKQLSVHHFQRSGDIPVGVVFNIIQYAAFTMMLAQVTGYTPKELVYTISDAHIYESQFEHVKQLLAREPRTFPTMMLDSGVKDLLDFRPEHFTLTDYTPHEAMIIPTPV
ncbi:MAG: thymidylate synthase [Candidatus Uhrbacteria bacterium]|nr:thymidylate synthase [Candidatus Uhrbacteria bacterium]